MSRRVIALAIAAAALLGLTACTGSPAADGSTASQPAGGADGEGDGGQSVADACALVQDTITEATDEFEEAASADPAAVVEAMKSASEKLGALASQITNDQVAAVLPSLEEMFAEVSEIMSAIVEGDLTKIDDLTAIGESFQQTTESFQELCAP